MSGPTLPYAQYIHAQKYRAPNESFREAMNRIATALKDDDTHWKNLRDILLDMRFLPGGRIQSAVGSTRSITPYNCYVSGTIDDSFVEGSGSIMQRATEAAATMRMGGGIGYDFSTLRPRGALVRKLQSQSSGPVSFMDIFNAICLCVASSGHRRGAQMGVLRIDHPDIEEFVFAKQNTHKLTGFNVSVAVTDEFMRAVESGSDFNLRWNNEVYKTVKATALWEMIMRSTWDWAEPGILFIDAINNANNLWYLESIAATNPCFAPDTLITTNKGLFLIKSLVGKEVTLWDGERWTTVDNFRVTGRNEKLISIELQDGSLLKVTPYHKMILEDGSKVEARALSIGSKLKLSIVESHGTHEEPGAYAKGFFLGDGSEPRPGRAWLAIYEGKEVCKNRIVSSIEELSIGIVKTNVVTTLSWNQEFIGGLEWETLAGLAPRKHHLLPWLAARQNGLPSEVFSWSAKSKLDFLAGYFDADGTTVHTVNCYGYQVSSISKKLLLDIQTLLKTFGILSKVGLMKSGGKQDITGETCETQDCWRLTISQANSIKLSRQVEFERLQSFKNKHVTYNVKPKMGKVVALSEIGVAEEVYCCTVPTTHTLQIGIGVLTGQCGEQPLPPFGACLLGSFNLVKYLIKSTDGYHIELDQLAEDIPVVVRAMDNVIDLARYPLREQEIEAKAKRRMGLGITGLANAVEACGYPYGTPAFTQMQEKILYKLASEAYRASVLLAYEKGAFPVFNKELYGQNGFVHKLMESDTNLIVRDGIRNSHLTSIAPTGTISLTANNVSSGIEPVFSYSMDRTTITFDGPRIDQITDYGMRELGVKGKRTSDVSLDEHLNVLITAQKYVDSAVSKTLNVPETTSWEDFKNIYLRAWKGGCKGCTTYRINSERGAVLTSSDEPNAACTYDPETGERSCE